MRALFITLGLLALVLLAWIGWALWLSFSIETPDYVVINQADGYEIREYPPHIVATVQVHADNADEAVQNGFEPLASYIFGSNQSRAKDKPSAKQRLAMTAPVIAERVATERYEVSFIMEDKYSLNTLPLPKDERVRLRKVPAKRYAVLTYTWTSTGRRIHEKEQELRSLLSRDGLPSNGVAAAAWYDPPYVPAFMKKNEVLIELP